MNNGKTDRGPRPTGALQALLAKRMVQWRSRANLTQADFGELLGTEGSTVSRWERNLQTIPLSMLETMMTVLRIPPDELVPTYREFLEAAGLHPVMIHDLPEVPLAGHTEEPWRQFRIEEGTQPLTRLVPLHDAAAVRITEDLLLLIRPYWHARDGNILLLKKGEHLVLGRLRADRYVDPLQGGEPFKTAVSPLGVIHSLLLQPGTKLLQDVLLFAFSTSNPRLSKASTAMRAQQP